MKIKNAIIMASGLGTRMRPLTLDTPKPLIKVHGVPMIETVIEAIRAAGTENITVVAGYLGEQFGYLTAKYDNVSIVRNEQYATVNNISSVYAARHILRSGSCLICEADLFVRDGSFLTACGETSGYFGIMKQGYSEDWVFEQDKSGRITRVGKGGDDCYNMMGFAYFTDSDAWVLADCIEHAYARGGYEQLFWDDVVDRNLDKLSLTVFPVREGAVTEIDTVEELEAVNSSAL